MIIFHRNHWSYNSSSPCSFCFEWWSQFFSHILIFPTRDATIDIEISSETNESFFHFLHHHHVPILHVTNNPLQTSPRNRIYFTFLYSKLKVELEKHYILVGIESILKSFFSKLRVQWFLNNALCWSNLCFYSLPRLYGCTVLFPGLRGGVWDQCRS